MDYEQFEAIAMPLMIFGLVAFMGFIVWDLAKQSKAGPLPKRQSVCQVMPS